MKKLGLFVVGLALGFIFILPLLGQFLINFIVAGIIPGTDTAVSPYIIFILAAVGLLLVVRLIHRLVRAVHHLSSSPDIIEDLEITSSTGN